MVHARHTDHTRTTVPSHEGSAHRTIDERSTRTAANVDLPSAPSARRPGDQATRRPSDQAITRPDLHVSATDHDGATPTFRSGHALLPNLDLATHLSQRVRVRSQSPDLPTWKNQRPATSISRAG